MTFHLQITEIGYSDPVLWWAVGIATLVAVLLGRHVGRWLASVQDPVRRSVLGVLLTCAVIAALLILPFFLLYILFGAQADGAIPCPAFVKPALLLPAVLGAGAEALSWWRRSVVQ
jgi:hypothetical protein